MALVAIPTSQMQSVCAVLEADILVSVLVSWVLRGEEIKDFHMRYMYCGPSGVNLSTSKH